MPDHTSHATLASAAERAMFGNPDFEDRISDVVDQHLDRLDYSIDWAVKLRTALVAVEYQHGEPPWLEDLMASLDSFIATDRKNYAAAVEECARGDFIGEPTNDRSVACCVDTALAIVGAWARGETWVPPTEVPEQRFVFKKGDLVTFKNSGDEKRYGGGPYKVQSAREYVVSVELDSGDVVCLPPSNIRLAPDAAPAPFRVGDRVVFRDKGRRILESAGPWTVDAVSPYRTVLLNVHNDLRDWWVDEGELRYAPGEV